MAKLEPSQPTLFELADEPLEPAEPEPEHVELATRLTDAVRLGTMSWAYPGWRGVVYAATVAEKQLASCGLTAYTRHPLLTTVEIDRTYYEPLPVPVLRKFAEQVPASFRFVVKAHEGCVVHRFPLHARYGKKRGQENSLYLDPAYATEAIVEPVREALGEKLGVLLFQFPPRDVGHAASFARDLCAFLQRLPPGIVYAVELRNRELLGAAYADALAASGAVHCHNVWGEMPSVLAQARRMPPLTRRPLIVRWLMRRGVDYRTAGARYMPFNRIIDEDVTNRSEIAHLIARATEHGVSTFALLDNKAEGCAPESAVRLARAIVQECRRPD
jgi:uncharacterized protein YecE (DUF72 family)